MFTYIPLKKNADCIFSIHVTLNLIIQCHFSHIGVG